MRYLAATHNPKKCAELLRILAPLGIDLLTDAQAGMLFPDVEETGETFLENALLKARAGCAASGLPCVADDSGLCVDALDGAPGVYSARYAGRHGDDTANNEKLLQELRGITKEKRTARFVCIVCVVYPDGRELTAQGVCAGYIGFTPQGEKGFGYDPLFHPAEAQEDCSMAQLTSAQKDSISHRGKALQKLAAKIRNTIGE